MCLVRAGLLEQSDFFMAKYMSNIVSKQSYLDSIFSRCLGSSFCWLSAGLKQLGWIRHWANCWLSLCAVDQGWSATPYWHRRGVKQARGPWANNLERERPMHPTGTSPANNKGWKDVDKGSYTPTRSVRKQLVSCKSVCQGAMGDGIITNAQHRPVTYKLITLDACSMVK